MTIRRRLVQFRVVAKSALKRRVFGWASVAKATDGHLVVDSQGDVIFPEDLEDAAAEFVKQFRQGGEMHEGRAPNELVASMVFTLDVQKAMGIPDGTLPQGWFVGFEVPSDTFAKVTEGSMLMFSIEGEADKEQIEVPDTQKRAMRKDVGAPDSSDLHVNGFVGGGRARRSYKSVWPTSRVNNLPDSAFAVIEPGGKKDQTGKTTPRDLRHLPLRNEKGKLDEAHVRNAISQLPKTKISAQLKAEANRKIQAAARSLGIGSAAKRQPRRRPGYAFA